MLQSVTESPTPAVLLQGGGMDDLLKNFRSMVTEAVAEAQAKKPRLVDVNEMAETVNVSPATIARFAKAGVIPEKSNERYQMGRNSLVPRCCIRAVCYW